MAPSGFLLPAAAKNPSVGASSALGTAGLIGGTEKNGYHMVLGKHNYTVTHAANLIARKLGNALVAPTLQYVPEGDPDRSNPGAISLPSPAYDSVLDAIARSLRTHGATDILFIGDSGGNQAGMTNVANKLNDEWKGGTTRVYALTAYYNEGREHYRAWMDAAFGYGDDVIGRTRCDDGPRRVELSPSDVACPPQ